MNRLLTGALLVLLFGGAVFAEDAPKPAAKPATDLCKDAVDPYEWIGQKTRFFAAAGPDNELTEKEFRADKEKADGFTRSFDKWRAISFFDEDGNRSIDWLEADAYRWELRQKVLAAYDADKDGKLTGDERIAANKGLGKGKIAAARTTDRARGSWPGHGDTIRRYDKDGDGRSSLKKQLGAVREEIAASAAVADLQKAYDKAKADYEWGKKAPDIVEARRVYDDTKEVYEKARAGLLEAELAKRARKAYDDARHALPEYKAAKDAEKALDEAAKAMAEYMACKEADKACRGVYDEQLAGARKARDEARKARDAKVDELLKAHPDAARISDQISQIEAKIEELRSKAKAR